MDEAEGKAEQRPDQTNPRKLVTINSEIMKLIAKWNLCRRMPETLLPGAIELCRINIKPMQRGPY